MSDIVIPVAVVDAKAPLMLSVIRKGNHATKIENSNNNKQIMIQSMGTLFLKLVPELKEIARIQFVHNTNSLFEFQFHINS